jgi:DNA invertase Pin-like site-specific DNA recombinase/IS30 family transposase
MSHTPNPRINRQHLERSAIIYVRQSSPEQVRCNVESTRLQLGLRRKAIDYGWREPIVIDGDLGISAGGFAERKGFQHMLAQVATRRVGIILCTDASRLSRNSKDWAHLFELCGYFQTLIADLEQIYDLSQPNDRLVMGIKGTMSEMELVILKTRLRNGAEAKASRGELKFVLPTGYAHDPKGNIVMDPDKTIQSAIRLMFSQFKRASSVRQLGIWYRETQTRFPVRRGSAIEWKQPPAKTLYNLLAHPFYAGVYVYGRKPSRIEYVDGKLVRRQGEVLRPEDCRVCIRDHHSAYISWDILLANQARLAENRPRWKMEENRGAIREGLALLTGLLRCRNCGGKIYVTYKKHSALYYCDAGLQKGMKSCLAFGSKLIDRKVSDELLRALEPHGVEAAIKAEELEASHQTAALEHARLEQQAARYEADRAFEQYDQVDPRNRLVADTLEERLNEKLTAVNDAEENVHRLSEKTKPISDTQRATLYSLAEDLPRLWHHALADPKLKKRILRAAIHEILVAHEPETQRLEVTIHWQGGVHTRVHVKKRATPVGRKTDPELIDLVRGLVAEVSDAELARILNMKKLRSPHGHTWTQDRVRNFRRWHRLRRSKKDDTPSDTLSMKEAADYLGISHNGLLGLERLGAIARNQATDFAPWRVSQQKLDSKDVKRLVSHLKRFGRLPKGGCPKNQKKLFD